MRGWLPVMLLLLAACGQPQEPVDPPAKHGEPPRDPVAAAKERKAVNDWFIDNGVTFDTVDGEQGGAVVSVRTLGVNLDDDWLRRLRSLTQLRTLILHEGEFDDLPLLKLPRYQDLRRLDLTDSLGVRGAALAWAGGCQELRIIQLGGTAVDDMGVGELRYLRHLKELVLRGTRVTGAGLQHLTPHEALETLDLVGLPIADLAPLQHMTQLKELRLEDTQVGDETVRNLSGLTELWALTLHGTAVTDAGLKHLSGLSALKLVSFPENVTGKGLRHLKGMAKDGSVRMSTSKPDHAAIRFFRQARPDVMVELGAGGEGR